MPIINREYCPPNVYVHYEASAYDDIEDPLPPLAVAIQDGDLVRLRRLVEEEDAMNTLHWYGPLHRAVQHNNIEAARLLVSLGANPAELGGERGLSVTHFAASLGYLEFVRFLVDECHVPVDGDVYEETPLSWLCSHSWDQGDMAGTAEFLLKAGASTKSPSYQKITPLHSAAREGLTSIVRLLV